jgi:hypothetical protein
MSTKRDINLYLFYEFGLADDEDEAKVSDVWPFVLHETSDPTIYEFSDGHETYFLATRAALAFYPAAGMTITDLQVQQQGARWIGARDPIDLETSRLGIGQSPPVAARRMAIEELIVYAFGSGRSFRIIEGLFLLREQRYIALIEDDETKQSFIIGNDTPPQSVGFPEASPWRRLAVGVGEMLRTGRLIE